MDRRHVHGRWGTTAARIAAAACLAVATTAFAAEEGSFGGPDPVENVPPVTDAQVVAAMHKGIDFLLKTKKLDNWEGIYAADKRHTGGETAIVFYALLHAAESLQDDPEYQAKLSWRGPELAPVMHWLMKTKITGTYATGLAASAFTLLPKIPDEKPGEGVRATLESYKLTLLNSRRRDGGYTYDGRTEAWQDAWKAHFDALAHGAKGGDTLKKLHDLTAALNYQFGGVEVEIEKRFSDLRILKTQTKDARELAKIDIEMRELQKFKNALPRVDELTTTLATYRKNLAELEARHGNPKPPMTKAELETKLQAAREAVKNLEWVVWGDCSNSQYGTLGAWALMDYGIEMPNKFWENDDRFWRKTQLPDGRWPYGVLTTAGRDSMGVAGIASLFVDQEFTDTEIRLKPRPDRNIELGLAWLNKAFRPDADLYTMYGVERVGLASGLKFFGATDWYKTGAAHIVKRQARDGSWYGWGPPVGTSYALLFLARGRNPVAFNKLEYNGPWNARPRDNAYVTRWMSKRFEKPINWQVVNLQVSPEEWMDAPILMITGSQDPKFTKEDLDKLRTFVNAGGMIFSTSDGATQSFTLAMKRYAEQLSGGKYEMRQLPRNHPLFSKEMGVDLPNPPPLLGLGNGSRELWVHSPGDVGADWQGRKYASKTSFELGAALYFYASGMGSLRSKLQPLTVAPTTQPAARTIELARLDYAGNSDPEPGAWARMAKLARAEFKTDLKVQNVKFGQLDARKYQLAHLTGTTHVTWRPEDAKALRDYLDAGGLLFIDPAGGSAEFAASAKDLVKQAYPEAAFSPLMPEHPVLAGAMPDGQKIADIELRKYANQVLKRRATAPMLEQLEVGGKTRVLFSPWDVSSGFLGTNTWGIVGYVPASAEKLGRNIILYAAEKR